MVQTGRVLIVDDELPIRTLLARMITGWGYGVRHVGSAVEALEVMAAEPADILLCDVSMPEHDGLWLAEQVHARWPSTATSTEPPLNFNSRRDIAHEHRAR